MTGWQDGMDQLRNGELKAAFEQFKYAEAQGCFFLCQEVAQKVVVNGRTCWPKIYRNLYLDLPRGAKWMGVGVPLSNPLGFKHHPLEGPGRNL